MPNNNTLTAPVNKQYNIDSKKNNLLNKLIRDRYLYLLALPGIIFFIVFKYIPLIGIVIAFQNYSPFKGILKSKWVGFEHFQRFFTGDDFWLLFRNTLAISLINLVIVFPLPIILSLMLNEIRNAKFKRTIQSVIYIPHFFSWVIIFSLTFMLFSPRSGLVNQVLLQMGYANIDVFTNPKIFWFVLACQHIFKDTGWGTIVILASIAGIDLQIYEAAIIDGAGRLKQMWYITLPSIRNIIVILLILKLGHILDVGFEQILLMTNGAVSEVSDVFDYYVYRLGILQGQFSFTTAVGFFKSGIGLILVVISNKLANKFGEHGVY